MTERPGVGAFVPCFDNAPTLARVIRSIRRQTVPVAEILVVDDGSSDGSAAIAAALGARLISHRRNLGRGAARARAIVELEHDLVLCCDATKLLDPTFVEGALRWFEEKKVAAVFGALVQEAPASAAERWRGRHLFKNCADFSRRRSGYLATWGTVLRRSHVLEVGNFDPRLRENEDGELGARLLAHGYELISDRDLRIVEAASNTVGQVLERHARWKRWNAGRGEDSSWSAYLGWVADSVTGMAAEDLRAGDLPAALISLLAPHYRLWRSRRRRPIGEAPAAGGSPPGPPSTAAPGTLRRS